MNSMLSCDLVETTVINEMEVDVFFLLFFFVIQAFKKEISNSMNVPLLELWHFPVVSWKQIRLELLLRFFSSIWKQTSFSYSFPRSMAAKAVLVRVSDHSFNWFVWSTIRKVIYKWRCQHEEWMANSIWLTNSVGGMPTALKCRKWTWIDGRDV